MAYDMGTQLGKKDLIMIGDGVLRFLDKSGLLESCGLNFVYTPQVCGAIAGSEVLMDKFDAVVSIAVSHKVNER
jgi:hypothetical protein